MKNIAIVGFGLMVTLHAQVSQGLPDARLLRVVDSRTEVATASLQQPGIAGPVFSGLATLLKNVVVDALDICLAKIKSCGGRRAISLE